MKWEEIENILIDFERELRAEGFDASYELAHSNRYLDLVIYVKKDNMSWKYRFAREKNFLFWIKKYPYKFIQIIKDDYEVLMKKKLLKQL